MRAFEKSFVIVLPGVQGGEQAATVEDQRQTLGSGFGRAVEFFLKAFCKRWIFALWKQRHSGTRLLRALFAIFPLSETAFPVRFSLMLSHDLRVPPSSLQLTPHYRMTPDIKFTEPSALALASQSLR